jgi:hypothetical protein
MAESKFFDPYFTQGINTKARDRIIRLRVKEGMKPETSQGHIDARLFKNENQLHAIQQETGLWTLKIDHGSLPPALESKQWTNFNNLRIAVAQYYDKRNIEISEIIE